MRLCDGNFELKEIQRLEGHTTASGVSPGAQPPAVLASCGGDKTVRIWQQNSPTGSFECKLHYYTPWPPSNPPNCGLFNYFQVPMIVVLAILCHIDLVASHTPDEFMNHVKESWLSSSVRCYRDYSSLSTLSRISEVVFWTTLVIVLVVLVLVVCCILCVHIRAVRLGLDSVTAPQGLNPHEIELVPLIGAPQGLNPHEIELLPLIGFPIDIELGHETSECHICIEEFMQGDIIRMLPACRHVYHAHCIDLWISKNSHCPVCRHNYRIGQS